MVASRQQAGDPEGTASRQSWRGMVSSIGDLEEKEAVRLVQVGTRNAFRVLVEKYAPSVIAFCTYRLNSREEALDAAQEIFAKAYLGINSFDIAADFGAWLFGITLNHIRSLMRRRSSEFRKLHAVALEEFSRPAADPAGDAEDRLAGSALREAVAALPASLSVPVELYYFAELPVAQIAKLLDIGEEAVKSRLFRARKMLKRSLAPFESGRPEGEKSI
ncbi:MAG: sigma-70 family RNA polymerase sigma factor [Spirochaetales bacterium]|nr:sigma-70 family RNA polymerase sigma factor [Spirochaetales bacterium]